MKHRITLRPTMLHRNRPNCSQAVTKLPLKLFVSSRAFLWPSNPCLFVFLVSFCKIGLDPCSSVVKSVSWLRIPGLRFFRSRMCLVLWLVFSVFGLPARAPAAMPAPTDAAQRIQRGERFLANLFDTQLQLLPEYPGSTTYWLFHDNYLAAHLLEKTRPDLSRRIRSTLLQFGVTNSGKIEIVFGEASHPLPFRTYVLTNVAATAGKTIRTELVTTNLLDGWNEYADLLLLAALAEAKSAPADARKNFDQAVALWDGEGFNDAATRHSGVYATYKLALYLIAADRLHISAPHRDEVIARLVAMQSRDGGCITDYKAGKPVGLANVETTCLALLALQSLRK